MYKNIFGLFVATNYQGTPNILHGCLQDQDNWRNELLPALAGQPLVLRAGEATTNGITNGILDCLKKLTADDLLVIQYSGHGTQVPDLDGDEPDRQDEAIVPNDYQNGLILDDMLGVMLKMRDEDSGVLLITDCCHFHTGTRDFSLTNSKRPRYLPFEKIIHGLSEHRKKGLFSRLRPQRRKRPKPKPNPIADLKNVVHLSGCDDDQVSYDAVIEGKPQGAFSYHALKALRMRQAGETVLDWYRRITTFLPSPEYDQRPCLTGEEMAATWILPGA